MKKIRNSYFYPSDNLGFDNLNKVFLLGLDCFLYEDSIGEIFFSEYVELDSSKIIYIFDVPDLGLVSCYKVISRVENSDCFNIEFVSTIERNKFQDSDYLKETFNIYPPEIYYKLIRDSHS